MNHKGLMMVLNKNNLPSNKYINTYINLINSRQLQSKEINKTEAHHVYPKSIFGDNKIIVHLTYREHFIAHWLLYKGFRKEYGDEHDKTIKMWHAFHSMSNVPGNSKRIISKNLTSEERQKKYSRTISNKQVKEHAKTIKGRIKIVHNETGKVKIIDPNNFSQYEKEYTRYKDIIKPFVDMLKEGTPIKDIEKLGYNRKHLYEWFHKIYGIKYSEYLKRKKL